MLTSCISRLYMAHSLSIATVMAILMAHCYRHTYGTLLWTYVWHTVTDIHMAHCYGPTYGTLLWTYVWHTLRISVIFHMLTSCISRLYMAHSLSIATVMDIVMAHCYGHTYGTLLWTYLWRTFMDVLMAHSYGHTYGTLLWTYLWRTVMDVLMANCYGHTYGTLLWTYLWHTVRISVILKLKHAIRRHEHGSA